MRSLALPVILGLATAGTNAHRHANRHANRHAHAHAHLHARGNVATVVELFTQTVTACVYDDGTPCTEPGFAQPKTSSPSASSSAVQAVFLEVTTSRAAPTTTPLATSSTLAPVIPPVAEVKALPSVNSTTDVPTSSPTHTLALPTVTAPSASLPDFPAAAGERVFTIINSHTAAISTHHDDTVGTPTAAGKGISPGTMAPGAVATFAVPPGWVGNIAINEASFPITNDATLIEANFVEWWGVPRADFDISFVNGFTLPAVCSCAGQVTTGCNLDLHALNPCPNTSSNGGCANPLRALASATKAASFFAACEGAAWTFVEDGKADSQCITGNIECCIGTACPPNPKQGSA